MQPLNPSISCVQDLNSSLYPIFFQFSVSFRWKATPSWVVQSSFWCENSVGIPNSTGGEWRHCPNIVADHKSWHGISWHSVPESALNPARAIQCTLPIFCALLTHGTKSVSRCREGGVISLHAENRGGRGTSWSKKVSGAENRYQNSPLIERWTTTVLDRDWSWWSQSLQCTSTRVCQRTVNKEWQFKRFSSIIVYHFCNYSVYWGYTANSTDWTIDFRLRLVQR